VFAEIRARIFFRNRDVSGLKEGFWIFIRSKERRGDIAVNVEVNPVFNFQENASLEMEKSHSREIIIEK
jgi:hypothetical protein